MQYLGTSYRYGATSPSTGFDCSGFIYCLYGAVFGQRMPHDVACHGTPVARGDLVFFGYRGAFTHRCLCQQRPVHVTLLDSAYYRERYITAMRLSPQYHGR